MIRILHIVGNLSPGGMGNFLMNIYRRLDKNRFQFDFIVMGERDRNYHSEAMAMGAKIYKVTRMSRNPVKYYKEIKSIIKDNGYEIVFRQTDTATVAIDLLAAKRGGASVRIPHSHSTDAVHPFFHKLFRPLLVRWSTERYACSNPTGKWMYGNAFFKVIYNGIDLEEFSYKPEVRSKIRNQLLNENKGCNDETWIFGHVGNFWYPKNHAFLLEIFKEIRKKHENSLLVLVGDGELFEEIKQKAAELKIDKNIIFTGSRGDVANIMQALDCLIFPSIYEGLPITLIESQGVGLPCLISDVITDEVIATELVVKLGLNKSSEEWAMNAMDIVENSVINNHNRKSHSDELRNAGYDIKELVSHYENLLF